MTELKRRRRRAAPAGIAPNEPERDILDQYLYEVSTYPLLKGTEEIDLAKKIRSGDQEHRCTDRWQRQSGTNIVGKSHDQPYEQRPDYFK